MVSTEHHQTPGLSFPLVGSDCRPYFAAAVSSGQTMCSVSPHTVPLTFIALSLHCCTFVLVLDLTWYLPLKEELNTILSVCFTSDYPVDVVGCGQMCTPVYL